MTAARAKALREPGRCRADQTLYLRVKPSGRESWVQRLTVHGTRRDIGLGPFDLVTLAEARVKAWENRRAVFEGRDPLAERRPAKAPTFRETAARTLEGLHSQWRNEKHAAQWATTPAVRSEFQEGSPDGGSERNVLPDGHESNRLTCQMGVTLSISQHCNEESKAQHRRTCSLRPHHPNIRRISSAP